MYVPEDVQFGFDAPDLFEKIRATKTQVQVIFRRYMCDQYISLSWYSILPRSSVTLILESIIREEAISIRFDYTQESTYAKSDPPHWGMSGEP